MPGVKVYAQCAPSNSNIVEFPRRQIVAAIFINKSSSLSNGIALHCACVSKNCSTFD